MMHHHKLEHLVKKIVLLSSRSKSQWRPITVSVISSELLILLQPSLVWWDIIAILSSELLILLQPNLVSWYNVYHCYLIFWTADPAATKFSLMIHHCRPRRQTDMSPLLSFCLGLLLFLSGHFFANGAFSRFLFSRNSPVFFIKTVCYVRDQLLCMALFRRW